MTEVMPDNDTSFRSSIAEDERQQKVRDRLRHRYYEMLGDRTVIEVGRAYPDNSDKWKQIGKLRADVYVTQKNYLDEAVLDEYGREYDEYDDMPETVHICATDAQGEVMGYIRILSKDTPEDVRLPAEKAFRTELDDRAAEFSRLISKKDFAGSPLVTLSLIRAAMHEINAEPDKYSQTVAVLEPFLALHLDNMGIPIKTLIDMQETPEFNSSNMLVEFDCSKIVERATAMDSERKFSPVYPEQLGPWFDEMKAARGLGRVALTNEEG